MIYLQAWYKINSYYIINPMHIHVQTFIFLVFIFIILGAEYLSYVSSIMQPHYVTLIEPLILTISHVFYNFDLVNVVSIN